MNIEANFLNNQKSEQEKEIEEKRQRVENLKKSDNHYEDSMYDLASAEGEYREKLTSVGVTDEKIVAELADTFSDETIGKIEAEKEKWRDDLTGLLNKNAYNGGFSRMMEEAKRNEQESSFLMIDFDHFKKVNDTLGHGAGDVALQDISSIIKKSLRSSDAVYRFGGEEFIAYLPDTTSVDAQMVAEKIRKTVEKAAIHTGVNDVGTGEEILLKKTISVGCVGTDQIENWQNIDNTELRELVTEHIDRSVYTSKSNGRNQVTVFQDDLPKVQDKK